MSFLDTTTDDVVTVTEAIAFIDSFETSDDQQIASKTDNSSTSSHSSSTAHNKKPKRKKKSNPPGYTTQMQRRKRAELQNLRNEARGLEEQLRRLETMRLTKHDNQMQLVDGGALAFKSKWRELVEIERNRRRHSEETNRRLKATVALYLDVNKNLH